MSGRALVIRRRYPNVGAEDVYDAWTKPETVADWYGPEGFTNTIHEMDLRVGGAYRLTMKAPDGAEYPLSGRFRVLDKPRKLAFTWVWENPPPGADRQETLVTVDIRAAGTDTELVLTHEGFVTEEQRANHEFGWTGALDKLGRRLARPA